MESYQYLSEANDTINGCLPELLRLIGTNDGWEDLGDNDGVRGSQMTTPEGKQLIKSIGILYFSPEEIREFVLDGTKKKDEMGCY